MWKPELPRSVGHFVETRKKVVQIRNNGPQEIVEEAWSECKLHLMSCLGRYTLIPYNLHAARLRAAVERAGESLADDLEKAGLLEYLGSFSEHADSNSALLLLVQDALLREALEMWEEGIDITFS